jgi:Holliday junction resolvase RusA-like endonuclease
VNFEEEQPSTPIHELEIPMLAPSVNSYWKVAKWGGRYITADGVRFKNLCMAINRGKRVHSDKCLALEIMLYSERWFTKKGLIHKKAGDVDNFCKSTIDSYFAAIGLDDSQVFELSVTKQLGPEKTIIRLYEFELDVEG